MKAKVPKFTIAVCNQCAEAAPVIFKIENLDGDIQRAFYECSKCGYKATVCYTDAEIREALKKQERLTASGNHAADANAEHIHALMGALQRRIEGDSHASP